NTALAAGSIVEEYYVPLPENDMVASRKGINSVASGNINGVVSIAIGGSTTIYYDQWANGYEPDLANPLNLYSSGGPGWPAANLSGTQIWGNNNACDGIAPGFGTLNSDDLLTNGDVIVLTSSIPIPRNSANIFFDGGDKFA